MSLSFNFPLQAGFQNFSFNLVGSSISFLTMTPYQLMLNLFYNPISIYVSYFHCRSFHCWLEEFLKFKWNTFFSMPNVHVRFLCPTLLSGSNVWFSIESLCLMLYHILMSNAPVSFVWCFYQILLSNALSGSYVWFFSEESFALCTMSFVVYSFCYYFYSNVIIFSKIK